MPTVLGDTFFSTMIIRGGSAMNEYTWVDELLAFLHALLDWLLSSVGAL